MKMALPTRNKQTDLNEKFNIQINMDMANLLLEYVMSSKPTQMHLANLKQLMDVVDIDAYGNNYDMKDRLILIRKILDLRTNKGLKRLSLIKEKIKEEDPSIAEFVDSIQWVSDGVTGAECNAIRDWVEEKMQYYFFYLEMPAIVKIWEDCVKGGFESNCNTLKEINQRMAKLVLRMKNTTLASGLLREFNFADPNVSDAIRYVVKKAQRPSNILQTGIRNLNAILGPGFRGGKLYTILGMSGKFKSGTLLNIADQITKFNPLLEKVVDGKRNTILFVTMENSIDETIERLYNMYADETSDYLKEDPEKIIDTLRKKGKFCFDSPDSDGISIEFRYFNNLEINTNDLYRIIDEMEEMGKHTIGLILDYIKRINSVFPSNGDETLRVTYVAKELKSLAMNYNIPVITAQQINRMGNAAVDSAMREGKQDLIKFVGNSDIGSAWGVVEESDWVAIINLEQHVRTKQVYLTIKRTKNRCGHNDLTASDYFNHPFSNGKTIRLETDVDKDASISIMSLATDLSSVDIPKEDDNDAQDRPRISIRASANRQPIYNAIAV